MKKIILLVLVLVVLLNVYFFKSLETFCLDSLSLSWTMSKIAPYFSLLVLGLFIGRILGSFLIFKLLWLKKVVFIAVFLLPVVLGFALHPIYEGDFANEGVTISSTFREPTFKNQDLIVVTIPSCPHCEASIYRMKRLKQRNPDLNITYLVCTDKASDFQVYKDLIAGDFPIYKAKDPAGLAKIAGETFPAFLKIKDGGVTFRWTNDQFGVLALDEIEAENKK